MKTVVIFLMVMAVAASQLHSTKAAATHVVLDPLGWGVTTAGAYTAWAASSGPFNVHDILVFNFSTDAHNVAEVLKEDYDSCNKANPTFLYSEGPARITLNHAGDYYFICTVPDHCNLGQKLSITVVSSNVTTPFWPPIDVPPPGLVPASNSASSFGLLAALQATLLSVAMALF